jgi:uncharacterized membrane protein HdeD (DUF308 family)
LFARGCVAIAFAIVAWTRPEITLSILLIFFGLYVLGDGIMAIVGAVRAKREERRWLPFLIEGVFGVIGGVVILFAPAKVAPLILLVVAVWAVVTGVLEIIAALRGERVGTGFIVMAGVLRSAFGVVLLTKPHLGLETLLWVMACFAFAHGVLLIALSLRLRSGRREQTRAPLTTQPA